MAKVAGQRYRLKLVHGRLYLQGNPVRSLIDHDKRHVLISDLVPVCERLELVDRALTAAAEDCNRPGPFAFIYARAPLPRPGL